MTSRSRKSARALTKKQPKRSTRSARLTPAFFIKLIISPEHSQDRALRAWACISLIAWATLDQRAGKAAKAKKLRTRNSHDAGSIVLGWVLDQRLKQAERGKSTDTGLRFLLELFLHLGGFSMVGGSRSAKSILAQLQSQVGDLAYVHALADYMIKYHDHYLPTGSAPKKDRHFSIESAVAYITKFRPPDWKKIDRSALWKIWRKYKTSAPFIHAGFPILRDWMREPDLTGLKTFVTGQFVSSEIIIRVLNEAAYSADVLNIRIRGLRMSDFESVTRRQPASTPFGSDVLSFIHRIERNF